MSQELGVVYWEVTNRESTNEELAKKLPELLKDRQVLGLTTQEGMPAHPQGPALACRIRLDETEELVQVFASNEVGDEWIPVGKFTVPLIDKNGGRIAPTAVVDAWAEGLAG